MTDDPTYEFLMSGGASIAGSDAPSASKNSDSFWLVAAITQTIAEIELQFLTGWTPNTLPN